MVAGLVAMNLLELMERLIRKLASIQFYTDIILMTHDIMLSMGTTPLVHHGEAGVRREDSGLAKASLGMVPTVNDAWAPC